MKIIIKLICCFGCVVSVQAQVFTAKVIADSLDQYQINIVNITNRQGTTTQKNGQFSIPASVDDSIVFSSIKHEFKYHIVKASDFDQITEIKLKVAINELEEVVLSQYRLSGDINKDIKAIKAEPFDQLAITGFSQPRRLSYPERELKRIGRFSIGPAPSIPLDYIIMALNGDLAELHRLKDSNHLIKQKSKIATVFNHYFIQNTLEIDELYVEDFLYYCAEDENFIKLLRQNTLVAFDIIRQKALDYKQLKFNE